MIRPGTPEWEQSQNHQRHVLWMVLMAGSMRLARGTLQTGLGCLVLHLGWSAPHNQQKSGAYTCLYIWLVHFCDHAKITWTRKVKVSLLFYSDGLHHVYQYHAYTAPQYPLTNCTGATTLDVTKRIISNQHSLITRCLHMEGQGNLAQQPDSAWLQMPLASWLKAFPAKQTWGAMTKGVLVYPTPLRLIGKCGGSSMVVTVFV